MVFLLQLAIGLLPAVVGWLYFKGITEKEFASHVAAQAFVAGMTAMFLYYQDTGDVEILNGVVTGKDQTPVKCSHSYDCNCEWVTKGKGKDKRRVRECDTCYKHLRDYDWEVSTSLHSTIDIARIDDQGLITPPRWASTVIGEPVAAEHSYSNYIKAAPDSLFRHQGLTEKYKASLPSYPGKVYDYWHLNRVVLVGVQSIDHLDTWSELLSKVNSEVGPKKQVNMVLVVTNKPQDYFWALEQHWIGGKKNDAILVLGVDSNTRVMWAQVMAWSANKRFEVELGSEMHGLALEPTTILGKFREHVLKNYKRKPMHDFEYLTASIVPTTTQWVVSLIIGLAISIGLMFMFHYQDVFNEGHK